MVLGLAKIGARCTCGASTVLGLAKIGARCTCGASTVLGPAKTALAKIAKTALR